MKEIHRSILPVDLEHKKSKTGKMLCVYEGANKTYETQIGDEVVVVHHHMMYLQSSSKMINIDDVLRSLNNAVKD